MPADSATRPTRRANACRAPLPPDLHRTLTDRASRVPSPSRIPDDSNFNPRHSRRVSLNSVSHQPGPLHPLKPFASLATDELEMLANLTCAHPVFRVYVS